MGEGAKLKNAHPPRPRRGWRVLPQPLTARERQRYAPYFEPALLDAVRVFDGHVPFWLRPDMCGVTLGSRIYFRAGACDRDSPGGIELLAHELAHVQQFSQGMTLRSYLWASRRGYWRNPFEVDARAIGARVRAEVCGQAFVRPAAIPAICEPSRAGDRPEQR